MEGTKAANSKTIKFVVDIVANFCKVSIDLKKSILPYYKNHCNQWSEQLRLVRSVKSSAKPHGLSANGLLILDLLEKSAAIRLGDRNKLI